ncbi:ABC transporter ATP-binding protein [Microlunatus elymi]|uniref:ABC transporter ATP-binding protein n=2 Tax=Microlunatus elymi TaxID=2596828 RepID=A0A516Q5Z4_9ACTN|nr:ABC transporter ATP-binding protein [Microlunatus elymi]
MLEEPVGAGATTPGAEQPGSALELAGLHKAYGPVRAVDGVDLEVRRREIVAMLGPNGAGKSTINEMITGLVQPDSGRLSVLGRQPRVAVAEGRVGAMLQAGALLHDATTRDVLRLMHGLHRHPLPLDEVIERAELGDFLKTKSDKLSGGQAQRLRYALAIMPDPELLILDEPTVGMDVEVRRQFWASMRDFAADGRTVLFATHYLEEADEMADRIVVLNTGRVVADGTGAEIKSRVTGRVITVSPADVPAAELAALPAATGTERVGSRIKIKTADSDLTLRAMVQRYPQVCDIEVGSARLEDAFLALTGNQDQPEQDHLPIDDQRVDRTANQFSRSLR